MKSKDLKSCGPVGHIFPADKRPSWTKENSYFWAPEIHRVGKRWVVYYTAEDKSGKLALGAAWTKTPEGPWTGLGRPMLENPRVGLIDSHFFRDSDGCRNRKGPARRAGPSPSGGRRYFLPTSERLHSSAAFFMSSGVHIDRA